MKCTGRRLVAYTICVVLLSYVGFRLTHTELVPAVGVVNPTPAAVVKPASTQHSSNAKSPRKHYVRHVTKPPATDGAEEDDDVPEAGSPPPPVPIVMASPPPPSVRSAPSIPSPPPLPLQPPPPAPRAENRTALAKHPSGTYIKPKSDRPEDNQLTLELADHYAEDNVVMVTWANHHYHDFVKNWVRNVRQCGVRNFLVGAMDNELLTKLIDDEVPTFAMQSGMTTSDFGWGTENFHKMGRKKIELIHLFTEMGLDILVSDVDTAWLRNPMPYVARFPQADVLTSSDHLSNTAVGDGLEDPRKARSAANIGIMLLRHTAKDLAKEWVEVLEKDDKIWDQNAFNDLYRAGGSASVKDEDNVVTGYHGKLKIGILPVATFASGHTYFVQRMHEVVGRDPYVIHATFQFSGTDGKRHRLREALVWADPPEYYDPPGGLLAYDADVPRELLDDARSVEGHFALVNHQLLQVRAALAFAQKLGRTLVMPELYCGFDRWWAPHDGRIPGSDTTLPYLCPMDHVFEVETWLRPEPEAEFGKFIDFREYSFFDNPAVPAGLNESQVVVELVDECGGGKCTQGMGESAPKDVARIVAAKNLTDADVEKLLRDHGEVKVLRFNSMVDAFGGFADAEDAAKFSRRIKKYAAIWCCKHAHPGHIWYDMEFDVVPHVDRHNRRWTKDKPWTPTTGP